MTRLPVLIALLATFAAGCTTGRQRRGVELPDELSTQLDADSARAWVGAPDAEPRADSLPWWRAFGSAELDAAVEAALAGNLSLRAAQLRVEQSAAAARLAGAGRYPSIDATLSGGRQRTAAPPPVDAQQSNVISASVGASYEIDAWGRVSAGREAAARDVQALEADARAIGVTLSAQVTEAWLDGVHARARRALIDRQLQTQEALLELVMLRLSTAAASALDVEQQRQQIQTLRAQRTLLEAGEQTAANRLAALQGRLPEPLGRDAEPNNGVPVATLPSLPELPPLGVPADLLTARPDVVAARARAEAADARLAQAIADRLPSLRISASVFVQADSFANLFDQIFWNLLGNATAPLFNGGRRQAEVDRNEAVLDERITQYASVIIEAAVEVENALALEHAQRAYIAELESRRITAQRTLELAREQYREGVVDYLRILSTLSALQQVEQAQLDANRQLLSYRVQLHRALGGHYAHENAEPDDG